MLLELHCYAPKKLKSQRENRRAERGFLRRDFSNTIELQEISLLHQATFFPRATDLLLMTFSKMM